MCPLRHRASSTHFAVGSLVPMRWCMHSAWDVGWRAQQRVQVAQPSTWPHKPWLGASLQRVEYQRHACLASLAACAVNPKHAPVLVVFKADGVSVEAQPGELFVDVAARAGVDVELGCNQGNCGICEMELDKFSRKGEGAPLLGSGPLVIRTCVARVPPGFERLELSAMEDQIWGVDGFDT